jgi:hypothetical protein
MSRWKISVGKNVCIGSAIYVAIAPGRFVLDERQRPSWKTGCPGLGSVPLAVDRGGERSHQFGV